MCFIIDACSRMIVGWRVAAHMRTTMVLDAIEMATEFENSPYATQQGARALAEIK